VPRRSDCLSLLSKLIKTESRFSRYRSYRPLSHGLRCISQESRNIPDVIKSNIQVSSPFMNTFRNPKNSRFSFHTFCFVSLSALTPNCNGNTFHELARFVKMPRLITSVFPRATSPGFPLISINTLQGVGLDGICEQVLYQSVNCDNAVATLGEKVYHHGLNDSALMTSVCDPTCETSLKTARRRVVGACAKTPEIVPGYPALALIDSIYTGLNETCLKDNKTAQYCNGMNLARILET
jgi:hypothetical protein